MTDASRRVLFISYAYPPTGGGGVQRSVKFVKYLPQFGWRPTVLTAANASVPVQDSDLSMDLDPETTVLKARTLEPSYAAKKKLVTNAANHRAGSSFVKKWIRKAGMSVLQPDPQILWNPFAAHVAKLALRERQHDAIYVTGPPFSSFLLGKSLKQRFGLPLILDFRDEWSLASKYLDNHNRSDASSRRQLAMLGKVLRSADAVLTTTVASADELTRFVRQFDSHANVRCIYNGYDKSDFIRVESTGSLDDRIKIVYTGTLWRLTDISPLVNALLQLDRMDEIAASKIDLVLVGRRTPAQVAIVQRLGETKVNLECHDYVPHGQSLEMAASADILLLSLADQPGAERVVPAKLFEYLALGKLILAICGEGETASLLRTHGSSHAFAPHQVGEISDWILESLEKRPIVADRGSSAIESFSREHLTKQLAEVFDSVSN